MAAALDVGYNPSMIDAVELDSTVVKKDESDSGISLGDFHYTSFFDWTRSRYDYIIANPPYVLLKNIEESQKHGSLLSLMKEYSAKVNLYVLFLDRMIDVLADEGEMVVIVPAGWLFSSSALPLRNKMYEKGAITHYIRIEDADVFPDASIPGDMCIFRWEKGASQKEILFHNSMNDFDSPWEKSELVIADGSFLIGLPQGWNSERTPLSTWWTVRVGMVSGADSLFRAPKSLIGENFVLPYLTTKGVEYFIDPTDATVFDDLPVSVRAHLTSRKDALIARRIRKFDESNWWKWGAIRGLDDMKSQKERFYVFGRTRKEEPFFSYEGNNRYSGGIFGIFRNDNAPAWLSKELMIQYLNSNDARKVFSAMGEVMGTRLSILPSALMSFPIPSTQESLLSFIQ